MKMQVQCQVALSGNAAAAARTVPAGSEDKAHRLMDLTVESGSGELEMVAPVGRSPA